MDIKQNEKDNQHCGNALLDAVLIEEGNKLIAIFLGYNEILIGNLIYLHGGLQYHSSWDWLMPVVEKIKILEAESKGEFNRKLLHFQHNNNCIFDMSIFQPIERVWSGVIQFVKWYNENTPEV